MLFREIIIFYCENHMKLINTIWGQNAELYSVKNRWYIWLQVRFKELISYDAVKMHVRFPVRFTLFLKSVWFWFHQELISIFRHLLLFYGAGVAQSV
jgi:hypothetical protein